MTTNTTVFSFEQRDAVLIILAHGPFMEFRDNDIRNAYNEAYRLLSQPGAKHLVMDFTELDYFGSTFVGVLIRLARKARANSGLAALCGLSENMQGMLKTLMLLENPKVDFTMKIYADRDTALAALAQC